MCSDSSGQGLLREFSLSEAAKQTLYSCITSVSEVFKLMKTFQLTCCSPNVQLRGIRMEHRRTFQGRSLR